MKCILYEAYCYLAQVRSPIFRQYPIRADNECASAITFRCVAFIISSSYFERAASASQTSSIGGLHPLLCYCKSIKCRYYILQQWKMFQDFTLDFYFRQFWTDPRLAYKKRTGVETLSVGSEFIRNIWVPDTFFVNEKQSYFHIATTSNEFIRIHHSGSITRSIRQVLIPDIMP